MSISLFLFGRQVKNDVVMRSLTGCSLEEFEKLSKNFGRCLDYKSHNNGQKGLVSEVEEKLFLILLYLKCYPTYRVMGFILGLDYTRCCRWVMILKEVLEESLGRELVLPQKRINSVAEFIQKFPMIKDVFIDGTERKVDRPKKNKTQKKLYSGKKKAHTVKNVIICDERRRVLMCSHTRVGRRHDKRVLDKDYMLQYIPKEVTVWADTGFLGIGKYPENVIIPKKSTKKKPLTPEEKENNKIISGIRVVVEHAIMGIKRFKTVVHSFRNKKLELRDQFFMLASGLWNLKVKLA